MACKLILVEQSRLFHDSPEESVGRWGDGEMGRWGDGEMGRWGIEGWDRLKQEMR
ncbi:MAG: hypothetical protein F6K26_55380 [Moorea sp. SIO2I5]|nr:hypothetical protein [Moorena sp. SIO2I5]